MDVKYLADIALAACRLYELYLLGEADHMVLAKKMKELQELSSEYLDDFTDN